MAGNVMLMPHTETLFALRIGERVVLGALNHARAHGVKVWPMCSFVRHGLAKHPKYLDLIALRKWPGIKTRPSPVTLTSVRNQQAP